MAASAPITASEVQEYERILKISDEIFAGSHPRLKVPQQFVRKPGARNGPTGSSTQQAVKSKPLGSENPTGPISPKNQAPRPGNVPSTVSANPTPPSARLASKPVSEIDPIFLTKSDDLVRAELQLQRQRLERVLRDKVEQKKQETKQKPALQDTRPDFNVTEVFQRALEVVPPVSLSEPSETNGDSFDENSFYSSRAPDSPDGDQRKPSPVEPAQPVGLSTRVPVENYADELQRLETLNRPGSDQEMRDAYPVADQRAPYSPKQPPSGQAEISRRLHESKQSEALEEPEYSPPAPVAPPINHRYYEQGVANGDGRGRYIDRRREIQAPTSPPDATIVRQNHITSPAAPRPSRVSPLAVAKVPSVQQLRDERPEHGSRQVLSDAESGRESPSGPASHPISRKRRRLQEKGDGARNVSYRRQDAEPSDTYIKEEPVSPPPFADDPSMIRSRHPDQQQPVYIDIASPRYTPVLERQELPARRPVYEVDPYHEMPVDQKQPRSISRLSTRRPARDDGDLRRVASLQYARQSDYPREYIEADPHGGRAVSYAVIERPQERPRYYEEVPSGYGPQYITLEDAQEPVYREPYYEEAPPPRFVPAPQRRFVVDEHGNQYEMIPTSRPQPMAPPPRPLSQMPKDVYDDRAPVRTASVRAPSVVHDPYVERRYMQEMPPPPQPVYRRVTSDYARPVTGERRTYATAMESHDPYARSGSVQVAEYLPRRPTYVEEHSIPQERLIPTSSVRPQQARFEEPHHEVVQRVGSVRPAGPSRDVSVFLDERQVGDYNERPYYIRERRYFEGDGGKRMALDGGVEPVQHVPQHY